MTELPRELITALQNKEQAQMKHRWAFSFMPVEKRFTDRDLFKTGVFLVGYCQTCDTSISSPVKLHTTTSTTKADIPKWGCVPPSDL